MRKYTPRRASRRWLDADCPPGVLAIIDHPKEFERYTVFYAQPVSGTTFANTWLGYRGMSEHPTHPQGIGMYGEMEAFRVVEYRERNHHRYATWSSLPDEVKDVVRRDLANTT